VQEAYESAAHNPVQTEQIRGFRHLYKADEPGSELPPGFSNPSVHVGDRGVYVKSRGLVTCGAKGTISAVYGTGEAQELELLLDQESLHASDLHGRAPPLQGVFVPRKDFLLFQREQEPTEDLEKASTVLMNLLKTPFSGPSTEPPHSGSGAMQQPVTRWSDKMKGQRGIQSMPIRSDLIRGSDECETLTSSDLLACPQPERMPMPSFYQKTNDRVLTQSHENEVLPTKVTATGAQLHVQSNSISTEKMKWKKVHRSDKNSPDWDHFFSQLLDLPQSS